MIDPPAPRPLLRPLGQDEQPDEGDYAPLRAAPQLSPRLGAPQQRRPEPHHAAAAEEYTTAANAVVLPASTSPLAGFSHLTEGPEVGVSAGGSALDLPAEEAAADEETGRLLGGGGRPEEKRKGRAAPPPQRAAFADSDDSD